MGKLSFLSKAVSGTARTATKAVKGVSGASSKLGPMDIGGKVALGAIASTVGLTIINSNLESPIAKRQAKMNNIASFSSQLDNTYR